MNTKNTQQASIFEMSCQEALTENGMKKYIQHYKEQYQINGKIFNEETEKNIHNTVKKTCEYLQYYEKTMIANSSSR